MSAHLKLHSITDTADHTFPGGGTTFLRDDGTFATPIAGTGDVVGPGASVDLRIATFSGVTGKLIQDSGTLIADLVAQSEVGAINGVASLDGTGRIPSSQLPTSAMEYKGAYNATTNTPTLIDGTGTNGDYYLVSVAGTQDFGAGNITFVVGDSVVYNGTIWERVGSSDAVNSVFSRTGIVVAAASDYDASQVDNDSSVTGAFVDDALNALLADSLPNVASDPGSPTAGDKWILDSGSGNRLLKYYDGTNKFSVELSQE